MNTAIGERIRGVTWACRHVAIVAATLLCILPGGIATAGSPVTVPLPRPKMNGAHSLEQLLKRRRSVREFSATPLKLAQLSQLLWAAQGITSRGGLRTAPSAGALYPLELYVAAGNVEEMTPGVYHYEPHRQRVVLVAAKDVRPALAEAAMHQMWIAEAPVVIVIGAVYARTAGKYGGRAARYVPMEVGHAAENFYLQAGDLGLGTCDVGAFDDKAVARAVHLPRDVAPLLLMPAGKSR